MNELFVLKQDFEALKLKARVMLEEKDTEIDKLKHQKIVIEEEKHET